MLIDSHVNLHHEKFADDVELVISRARDAGVRGMLTICDKISSIDPMRRISGRHRFIWRSVGAHPHYAGVHAAVTASDILKFSNEADVIGIGECGLDFHYNFSPADEQEQLFSEHIEASQESGLPLIIHTRDADQKMCEMLERAIAKRSFTPLLHCYTGGLRLAQAVIEMGGFVSFSGIVTFRNADDVRNVAAQMPLDRILIETDCPYLAPVPFRGRRCEPAHAAIVAEALASALNIEPIDFKLVTTRNFFRLFAKADERDIL